MVSAAYLIVNRAKGHAPRTVAEFTGWRFRVAHPAVPRYQGPFDSLARGANDPGRRP
jgi:hypothetical protein